MMDRRAFIAGFLAAPLAAEAQPVGKVYRIGFISVSQTQSLYDAFRQGLRERGWIEGQNLAIEWRFSEGRGERFPEIVAELVRLKVDVLVTTQNAATRAAMRATDTIPIIMGIGGLPVQNGLVASLARPGGNVTGLSVDIGPEIVGKMLQLLKETVPTVSRVAMIHAPGVGGVSPWLDPSQTTTSQEIELVARTLGMALHSVVVRRFDDLPGAMNALPQARPHALVVDSGPVAFVQRRLIIEFAAKHRLPGVYPFRGIVESGGLMSYGADLKDVIRRAGGYVDKILKGARPADLPVEQPTKFELVINLKTAKALG